MQPHFESFFSFPVYHVLLIESLTRFIAERAKKASQRKSMRIKRGKRDIANLAIECDSHLRVVRLFPPSTAKYRMIFMFLLLHHSID